MDFVETWGQFIVLMATNIGIVATTWSATNRRLERLEAKTGEMSELLAVVETQTRLVLDRLLPARDHG